MKRRNDKQGKADHQADRHFNPSLLVLRRESFGLTQQQLSVRLGISQAKLSRMEAGLLDPPADVLAVIARELRRPVEFFFQQEPVYGPGVSEFHHRMLKATGARPIRQAHARINEDMITLRRLLRSADLDLTGFDKLRTLTEDWGSPEEVARAVRASWNLPPGPIKSMTDIIENAGGFVFVSDFPSQMITAISRWAPDLPPVFFVSRDAPGDRQRLSLAHELGHLLLHDTPTPTMEQEANAFAAEFLMPAKEIRHRLTNPNLHTLATLKPFWKVSMQALLHRAFDLGLISDRKYRHLWMRLGQLGYRKREPAELDVPQEKPSLFKELIDLHRQQLRFTLPQLRKLLLFEQDEMQARYFVDFDTEIDGRPHLRLVT